MLKLSYILLFILLWSFILFVYNAAMNKTKVEPKTRQKRLLVTSLALGLWLVLQYLVSSTGFYEELSLPPRIPLFMVLPLLLFSVIFLTSNRKSSILHAIPIHIPIAYQSFRVIIESLFYFTFLEGILPIQVTFEGANYDVLIGITAIFMAVYAYKGKASKNLLIAWNYIGIGLVLFAAFTFVSSFYFPAIWNQGGSDVPFGFNQFPFLLLPLFLMPSAVFVHILSIIQLKRLMRNETV